jgi:hypothetical protein
MSKRIGWAAVVAVTASLGMALPAPGGGTQRLKAGAISLFNGKNLNGWNTWLGKSYKSNKSFGLNYDPKRVFSVVTVDGQPAIRVSGEVFGALTTQAEYENYSIRLEFKWGTQKWPPRERSYRGSGLLYHCVGRHGAEETYCMQSLKCQIKEEQCGDLWCVAGTVVDVHARLLKPNFPFSAIRYDPNGKLFRIPRHIDFDETEQDDFHVVKGDLKVNEFANEWNTIEVQTVGTTSVHIVNGRVNMVATSARRSVDGVEQSLKRGRIQLLSEGAEVFFRNLVLRPLAQINVRK